MDPSCDNEGISPFRRIAASDSHSPGRPFERLPLPDGPSLSDVTMPLANLQCVECSPQGLSCGECCSGEDSPMSPELARSPGQGHSSGGGRPGRWPYGHPRGTNSLNEAYSYRSAWATRLTSWPGGHPGVRGMRIRWRSPRERQCNRRGRLRKGRKLVGLQSLHALRSAVGNLQRSDLLRSAAP